MARLIKADNNKTIADQMLKVVDELYELFLLCDGSEFETSVDLQKIHDELRDEAEKLLNE